MRCSPSEKSRPGRIERDSIVKERVYEAELTIAEENEEEAEEDDDEEEPVEVEEEEGEEVLKRKRERGNLQNQREACSRKETNKPYARQKKIQ